MRNSVKILALSLMPLGAAVVATPAMAQSKQGIAVANVDQAVAQSNAYTVARQQMETTYKPQIDQFTARKAAIEADLGAKRTALDNALKAAGGKPTPAIEAQYNALQTAGQNAQSELTRLGQPIQFAQAYVEEQISAKLNDALKQTMAAAKVDLIVNNQAAVAYQPAVDVTAQLKQALDQLVPSVSITPPAGWRPGGQQQGGAPAAATPPAQKPSGR